MTSVSAALAAEQRPTPPPATSSALALGMVGALGEELLALLVSDNGYRAVHVGVTSALGTAATRFRPWQIGVGVPIVDRAFVCLTDPQTTTPKASPIARFGPQQVLEAAQLARDAGARELILVSPLAALLQMGEATRVLTSEQEVALIGLGFERLLIVRPTAADTQRVPGWLRRLAQTMGRTLADIMLPDYTRALSAATAARAIWTAAQEMGPGVTVLGAKELAAIVERRLPGRRRKRRIL